MNNLVIITCKSTGKQKTYAGEYGLISEGEWFAVTHGSFKHLGFIGSRRYFFVDIESLDDDDDDF